MLLATASYTPLLAREPIRDPTPIAEPRGVVVTAPVRSREPRAEIFGYNHDMDICVPYNPDKNCGMRTSIYPLMREAGMGWQRYNLYWNKAQPTPGEIDWTASDNAVRLAAEQGIKTFISILYAPSWATGGQNWNEPFHCMVKPWATPEEKAKYAPHGDFLFDVPECANPAPLDIAAFKDFVEQVMRRYDGKHGLPEVSHYGFANEASNAFFWPPRHKHNSKPLDEQLDELYDWMLKPGYELAKRIGAEQGRTIEVVGPDENNVSYFGAFLTLEERRGRVFDILSVHAYGRNPTTQEEIPKTMEDIVWQIDKGFLPLVREHGFGRKFWINESGFRFDAPIQGVDGLQLQADMLTDIYRAIDARPEIAKFFLYRAAENLDPWHPGETLPNTLGLIDGDMPRPSYYAVKEAIRGKR